MSSPEIAALRYRCRRGMLELDVCLRKFIDAAGSDLSSDERDIFADILERPDPVIFAYIFSDLKPKTAAEEELIVRIKKFATNK